MSDTFFQVQKSIVVSDDYVVWFRLTVAASCDPLAPFSVRETISMSLPNACAAVLSNRACE